MAIRIVNRSLDIPISERSIGHTGDNLVEIRTFELNRFYGDIDLSEFDFKLDTEINGTKNIIDLDKSVNDDKITLTWTVKESHILHPGHMSIQIRAFSQGEEKWYSAVDYVIVQASINATEAQPDPLPSEFVQMEQRVTAMKNDAEEAAQTATEQAGIATTKAQEASDSADRAWQSEQAAKASEDMAKAYAEDAEEFAEDAEEHAQIAANNILNGVNTHNESTAAHADIRDDIRTVEAIARGKATAYVFDTYAEMMTWLDDPENVAQLVVGDNLYIRDVGVKDYWWDGAAPSELEAEAPDLTDYYTKAQVDTMMPITITREDYEDLLANGQVEAGRIYFIIEGVEE
jgi:hypothetical protein